jgi:hypothetical protein
MSFSAPYQCEQDLPTARDFFVAGGLHLRKCIRKLIEPSQVKALFIMRFYQIHDRQISLNRNPLPRFC